MTISSLPYNKKRRAPKRRPPEIKAAFLEHQAHAYQGAERLLEEIVVHSGRRKRSFEVIIIVYAKPPIGVLVDQSLVLPIRDVEGIETKLQADPLI